MTFSTPRKSALRLFLIAALLASSALVVTAQSPAQPVNFSTRMRVQTGDNVGIGGVILSGVGPKNVIVRGIGPSLAQSGVTGVLADPTLELRNSDGVLLLANDNWKDNPTQRAAIEASGLAPKNDLESAIDWTFFNSDSFTVTVRGQGNTMGVALIEVYDRNPDSGSKMANISTRAFVETGSNIVIAGFVLRSDRAADRIVVRGIGPSLQGIANTLADPYLELRDSNGALLLANDDWADNKAHAAELQAEGLQPQHSFESAIVASLPSGSYTALLSGLNDGIGVGLVEVYDLGLAPAPTPIQGDVERTQTGAWNVIEKQHVTFSAPQFSGTFKISVYKSSVINKSDIGSRAALQGETAPIPFTASGEEIEEALKAITDYYAYGQFGDLELESGSFSYFASVGAINRDPIVKVDPGGTASSGFTIEFGSLVGTERLYNTWVAGMPLITIEIQ